jgi:hypothetical protein
MMQVDLGLQLGVTTKQHKWLYLEIIHCAGTFETSETCATFETWGPRATHDTPATFDTQARQHWHRLNLEISVWNFCDLWDFWDIHTCMSHVATVECNNNWHPQYNHTHTQMGLCRGGSKSTSGVSVMLGSWSWPLCSPISVSSHYLLVIHGHRRLVKTTSAQ